MAIVKESDITVETVRIINEELSTQMTRKLEEIKIGLDSQKAAINSITEKVIPGLQESIGPDVLCCCAKSIVF